MKCMSNFEALQTVHRKYMCDDDDLVYFCFGVIFSFVIYAVNFTFENDHKTNKICFIGYQNANESNRNAFNTDTVRK